MKKNTHLENIIKDLSEREIDWYYFLEKHIRIVILMNYITFHLTYHNLKDCKVVLMTDEEYKFVNDYKRGC